MSIPAITGETPPRVHRLFVRAPAWRGLCAPGQKEL